MRDNGNLSLNLHLSDLSAALPLEQASCCQIDSYPGYCIFGGYLAVFAGDFPSEQSSKTTH